MLSRQLIPVVTVALLVAGCSRAAQEAPASPTREPARSTTARPSTATRVATPTAANAAAFAEEVITRTNAERRAAGLPPLTKSINLMRAAQIQATQMATTNVLEHVVPGTKYPTLAERLAATQYTMRAAGENIGEGYRSSSAAVAGWMASSGHRANIMSKNYTDIGTAVAISERGGVYWVQVFGRPR